ncbi:MAG TPA: hypothetical protein VKZ18_19245 [Polyangia bacterium]|nr:hypothetical protein [Polyangia bacterium]
MKTLGVVLLAVVVSACGSGAGAGGKGGSASAGTGGSAAGAPGSGGGAGRGAGGASGSGGAAPQGTPLTGVAAVSAGAAHACALLKSGGIYCWGVNGEGELGTGATSANSTMAVPVSGISNATAIAASFAYTCAILADGSVSCWGSDESYQLGSNVGAVVPMPVAVPRLSGPATLIAGREGGACAVVSGGMVQCWGQSWGARFVDGGTDLIPSLPMTVADVSGVTAISVTDDLCVLTAGGKVECWGGGLDPVVLPGVTASAISGNCALVSGGDVQCWQGSTLMLADGGAMGPGGFTSLSSSTDSYCAVQGATGTAVYCWGKVAGTFGPSLVSGLSGVSSVSAGDDFACAAMNDGTARCWGVNYNGQLGNGMIQDSSGPATVLVPR